MDVPGHEDFAPYIDSAFRIDGWPGTLRLAMVDVAARPYPGSGRLPFMLLFHGPRGDILPEGLHRATAPDGRGFTIYVMPIHTPAQDRQEYQAVFN